MIGIEITCDVGSDVSELISDGELVVEMLP